MRKFRDAVNLTALTRETLAEIPGQLEKYMRMKHVEPLPASHRASHASVYHQGNFQLTSTQIHVVAIAQPESNFHDKSLEAVSAPPPSYEQSNQGYAPPATQSQSHPPAVNQSQYFDFVSPPQTSSQGHPQGSQYPVTQPPSASSHGNGNQDQGPPKLVYGDYSAFNPSAP